MSGMSTSHLTDDLVRARNELATQWQAELDMAMNKLRQAAGTEVGVLGVIQALSLFDDGIFNSCQALHSIRQALGLQEPVIPSSKALGVVNVRLFQGPHLGAASEQAIGG